MQSYEINKIINKYEHLRGLKHFYEWSLSHLSDSVKSSESSLGRVNSLLYIFEGMISLEDARDIKAHYEAMWKKESIKRHHHRAGMTVNILYEPFCFYQRYIDWAQTLIDAKSIMVDSLKLEQDNKRLDNDTSD